METVAIPEVSPKVLEHRKYVLREFIESEREYVKRLQVAYADYYLHIKSGSDENIPSELKNDLLSIFSTLPEIFAFHNDVFLQALESCNWSDDAAEGIMDCFLNHKSDFHSIYLPYCKNKPTSDAARVEYDKYFASRQSELNQKLNIDDLLIAPVQRLPKYQLLIRDLLKDTRKANMDVSKIEEAYELMMKIPQETNNIICMSLIRGVSRARLVSHGSLWRQNTLNFTCIYTSAVVNGSSEASGGISVANCNIKNESRQVFVFDHRILVAETSDSDGFFEHQLDIKTLNGRVEESVEDTVSFSFMTEDGIRCTFKASHSDIKKAWVRDINAILQSQQQMKKALLFGKAPVVKTVRMHSLSIDWSDSDSSVDSMPGSGGECSENEEDWPKQTGFQNISKPPGKVHGKPPIKPLLMSPDRMRPNKKKKKNMCPKAAGTPSLSESLPQNKITMPPKRPVPPSHTNSLIIDRPHSCYQVRNSLDVIPPPKSSLSLSPLMRSWRSRKTSLNNDRGFVYFPCSTGSYDAGNPRSPLTTSSPRASSPRASSPRAKSPRAKSPVQPSFGQQLPSNLYIAVESPPGIAEQVYAPLPGQVFLVEDVSRVDVWKVKVVSGDDAGTSQWVQRNCLEEYCAPISLNSVKKELQTLQRLGLGRFSEVKLVRSKYTKDLYAVKLFNVATAEEKFYRELCIGVRMKHKNLLTYHYGLQRPQFAITMDYINGRPILEHLMCRGVPTERTVAGLVKQLLEGLQYMHAHTIYHLDIRPENIIIDYSNCGDALKIIDYGAARHSGDVDDMLSLNYETCYNFIYVAPEVFKQINVAAGTDMWGVGLLIYIIFCGTTPFYNASPLKMIANITGLRYSIPEDARMSDDAKKLIQDILVASPHSRPSASAVLERSWFTNEDLSKNKLLQHLIKEFLSEHWT